LLKLLSRGAEAAGYATQLWTAERIRRLVWEQFGVRFHVHHVPKLLRQCGWSYQRPTSRARERDEREVQRWLRQEWPRIKKKSAGKRPR
jgi:transposase